MSLLDDILMLAEHFAINMARELEFELFSGFTEKAKRAMLEYAWPGNIRELKNVIERSVYRCNNPHLPVHDLIIDPFESPFRPTQLIKTVDRVQVQPNTTAPSSDNDIQQPDSSTTNKLADDENIKDKVSPLSVTSTDFPQSLKLLSQNYEVDLIKSALVHCQYNQKKTAQALELSYHQLRGYLKKYNLLEGSVADELS
jgi:psp operon transcriptional activator